MSLISRRSVGYGGGAGMLALLILALGSSGAGAQETKPATPPPAPDAKDKPADKETPLPPDAHLAQSIQLDGKALAYTVVVGALPVNDKGKKIGEVVFTAYTMEGQNRPVTFALNGAPAPLPSS